MTFEDAQAKKKALIEAAKQRTNAAKAEIQTKAKNTIFIKPEEAQNKIRIIFDNSSSMDSRLEGEEMVEHAKKGSVEYLRSCNPNTDAVAIHLLNPVVGYQGRWNQTGETLTLAPCIQRAELMTDLVKLASSIDDPSVTATGGTPLYDTIKEAQKATPQATRYVAFSDGEPNNHLLEDAVIAEALRAKTPIDTVFFGSKDSRGAEVMQRLAEKTGGIFLVFDPAKGVSFKDAFKYLSPAKRLMLMNAEFKAKLERGEIRA